MKELEVTVCVGDASLAFAIPNKATGQELFDLVVRTVGLRETWFFDLSYSSATEPIVWLKLHKKILVQEVKKDGSVLEFVLRPKFYPLNAETELIMPYTQHLFFLEIKQLIVGEKVPCTMEQALLLASYQVQALYGDVESTRDLPEGGLPLSTLLPASLTRRPETTLSDCEAQIVLCCQAHVGMDAEEAELAYVVAALALPHIGSYSFCVNRDGLHEMCIGPSGVSLFKAEDSNEAVARFTWDEIRNMEYQDKKFTIKGSRADGRDLVVLSPSQQANKAMMSLCVGYHALHTRRHLDDSLEVQHMKSLVEEEKEKKRNWAASLRKEQHRRDAAFREKEKLEHENHMLAKQLVDAGLTASRANDELQLVNEKMNLVERENALLRAQLTHAQSLIGALHLALAKGEDDVGHKTHLLMQRDGEIAALRQEISALKEKVELLAAEGEQARLMEARTTMALLAREYGDEDEGDPQHAFMSFEPRENQDVGDTEDVHGSPHLALALRDGNEREEPFSSSLLLGGDDQLLAALRAEEEAFMARTRLLDAHLGLLAHDIANELGPRGHGQLALTANEHQLFEEKQAEPRRVFISAHAAKQLMEQGGPHVVFASVSWGGTPVDPALPPAYVPGSITINTDEIEYDTFEPQGSGDGEPLLKGRPLGRTTTEREDAVKGLRRDDVLPRNWWRLYPDPLLFRAFADMGITLHTRVVLYGKDPTAAARMAWALLYAGVKHVHLLDGGLASWRQTGYEIVSHAASRRPAPSFGTTAALNPEYLANVPLVCEVTSGRRPDAVLADIRTEAEFNCESSPYTYIPAVGRIPGAVWGRAGHGPWTMEHYMDGAGRARALEEVQAMWQRAGITGNKEVIFYCGSGWRSSVAFLFALELGWHRIRNFDGGWYEWSMGPQAGPSCPVVPKGGLA